MKRKRLHQLAILSTFVLLATIPQNILPMIEAERVEARA